MTCDLCFVPAVLILTPDWCHNESVVISHGGKCWHCPSLGLLLSGLVPLTRWRIVERNVKKYGMCAWMNCTWYSKLYSTQSSRSGGRWKTEKVKNMYVKDCLKAKHCPAKFIRLNWLTNPQSQARSLAVYIGACGACCPICPCIYAVVMLSLIHIWRCRRS